jgi:hypothetical protein
VFSKEFILNGIVSSQPLDRRGCMFLLLAHVVLENFSQGFIRRRADPLLVVIDGFRLQVLRIDLFDRSVERHGVSPYRLRPMPALESTLGPPALESRFCL